MLRFGMGKGKQKGEYDQETFNVWKNQFCKFQLISNDKNHFKFITFSLMIWNLWNNYHAHHLVESFPIIPKNNEGLHSLGRLRCGHKTI